MGFEIYRFSGGVFDYKQDAATKEAKAILGGKGAGLVVMAQAGMPVPPASRSRLTPARSSWRSASIRWRATPG